MLKKLKKKAGNVTVLVALLMFAIMGMMAMVIDIGVVYVEKAKLSNALDAALLAGGPELPDRPGLARDVMEEYLIENGVSLDQVTIVIDQDHMGAEIDGTGVVNNTFAKIIGFDTTDISAHSRIILGYASSAKGGLRPFGVTDFGYNFGDQVILKEGAGDGYHGNYGAVALGGTGTDTLLYNALYGYDGTVSIGDIIYTEPGNMASIINPLKFYVDSFTDTFENHERGTDRIWTIPLFESMEVGGRDGIVVTGFAQFFVEGVQKKAGKAEITGRFIQYVTNGDIDSSIENKGTLGMKLVE